MATTDKKTTAKSGKSKVGGNYSFSRVKGTSVKQVAKKRNCSPTQCPQYTPLSASDAELAKQLHNIRKNAPKKMVNGKRKFEDAILAKQMGDALGKLHFLNRKAGDVIKSTGKTITANQISQARADIQSVVNRFKKYA